MGTLKLSQTKYIKKVLEKFSMVNAKSISKPLGSHLRLSKKQPPKNEADKEEMAKVPYASAFGNLKYAIVCTIPDIVHTVRVMICFMSIPWKEH